MTAAASTEASAGLSGPIVARILLEIAAVHFRPNDPFILTSGRASPVYIDCRKIISFPRARRKVIELAADLVEREIGFESLDAVAGGETAGIPYAAWLADRLSLPMLYIRKKPKGFGRGAQIEGDMPVGCRTLLVEDLATDGGSKVNFINAIRAAQGKVSDALVVFHYGIFKQSTEGLAALGVRLHGLATWWDVLAAARETGRLDAADQAAVRSFLEDPEGWSTAHGGKEPTADKA
ncbi:orotate phosphoribosyltransferase [Dongia soli]|uniref:Orotate phosphoribosyltransferase n=1 Tax=Dongia soli TaxID=600628 RepID=A0ABU5ECU1_9PROT|nr:orotate phosphoribosyltransferase [Dongia soli]MDY0884203.1 orotate phosphoribosyltransferase [Dongia soli]